MAGEIITIPALNPLRFVLQEPVSLVNTKLMDYQLAREVDKPGVVNEVWYQPWLKADVMKLQISSNYTTNTLKIYRQSNNALVLTASGTKAIDLQTDLLALYDIWEFSADMSALSDDKYYALLEGSAVGKDDFEAESEPFHLKATWRHTFLMMAYNNESTMEVDMRTGIELKLRLPGALTKPDNATVAELYDSDSNTPILTKEIVSKLYSLETDRLPWWMHEKVELMLALDYKDVDGLRVEKRGQYEFEYDHPRFLSGLGNVLLQQYDYERINRHDSAERLLIVPEPTALAATLLNRSTVELEWTNASENYDAVKVYRATAPGGPYTLIATLAGTDETYTDTGLTIGTTYYYAVRGTIGDEDSAYSSEVSVTVTGLFINVTTSNTSAGSSTSTQFKIPTVSGGTYNMVVSWGDGSFDTITTWNAAALTHTYSSGGSYQVDIIGTITGWQFNNTLDRLKITGIVRWGSLALTSLAGAFYGCANMLITATDTLNTSGTTTFVSLFQGCTALTTITNIGTWDTNQVTSMISCFQSCTNFNSSVNGWDVSAVTAFNGMFQSCTTFNQSLNSWNVSAATNMTNMFTSCPAFNSNITSWVTSSLTNMSSMFQGCTAFNQAIGGWDVADVTTLASTFQSCPAFNQSLNSWNVAKVTNMNDTFNGCTAFNGNITSWTTTLLNTMIRTFNACPAFNQNISSWNIASVTNLTQTFAGCTIFNQNINGWNVGACTSLAGTFQNCTAFNQALNSWNTANVTAFNLVFENCVAFNGNITSWNTAAATTMSGMFQSATAFNQAITGWNTGNVTTMATMFSGATAFNQAISSWSVPKVTTFASMFLNATAFNQDLGAWDVTITPRASLTMTNMLNTCGMNTANYDSTLVGWHAQAPIASVVLGASGRTYTAAGAGGTARAALVAAPYNWTITGDTGV